MRIAGSLWSVPAGEQASRLRAAAEAGMPAVHWDATDGVFAAAGGFTPLTASRLLADCPPVESEAHLMMHDPRPELPAWLEFCSLVTVAFEVDAALDAVELVARAGRQPGLAVSLQTPLRTVPADYPVLLMSITPGEAGSAFDPAVVDRVAELRDRGRNPLIGVDGGVGPAQFAALGTAGANWIVSGTSLFAAPDPGGWLASCRDAFAPGRDARMESPAARV